MFWGHQPWHFRAGNAWLHRVWLYHVPPCHWPKWSTWGIAASPWLCAWCWKVMNIGDNDPIWSNMIQYDPKWSNKISIWYPQSFGSLVFHQFPRKQPFLVRLSLTPSRRVASPRLCRGDDFGRRFEDSHRGLYLSARSQDRGGLRWNYGNLWNIPGLRRICWVEFSAWIPGLFRWFWADFDDF